MHRLFNHRFEIAFVLTSRRAAPRARLKARLPERMPTTLSTPPTDAVARLRSLIEHGVAVRFNLTHWASTASCLDAPGGPVGRLKVILEQIRPDVVKLIVMESLEHTAKADLDTMVYGETTVDGFLEFIRMRVGEVRGLEEPARLLRFYDLGSGCGKSVVTAALCAQFSSCVGIELLPCLHGIAECLVEDVRACVFTEDPRDAAAPSRPVVECRLGDIFTDASWTDGDFVFCNCVTWDEDTMTRLAALAERMRPGAVFVTVLAPLPSDAFTLVAEDDVEFSWGVVEALVHRRL